MTGWNKAWNYRAKTRKAAAERRRLKKAAHREARRGDGIVRLNGRDVI